MEVIKKYGFGQNSNDRNIQATLNIFVMQESTFRPFSKKPWRKKRDYYSHPLLHEKST